MDGREAQRKEKHMEWATVPRTGRVRGRGQLTLPAEIRKELGLDASGTLTVFRAGEAIILTPKRLVRASFAKEVQKEMKKQGLTLNDLLRDLKRQRTRYIKEVYGL